MKATEDALRPVRTARRGRRGHAVAGLAVLGAPSKSVPGLLVALVAAEAGALALLLASGSIPVSLLTLFRALLAL